jgi:hypothetical protein
MLVAEKSRLTSVPGRDHVHVLGGGIGVRCIRANYGTEDREAGRNDTDLLPNLPHQGIGQRLIALDMSAREAPQARIGTTVLAASSEQTMLLLMNRALTMLRTKLCSELITRESQNPAFF